MNLKSQRSTPQLILNVAVGILILAALIPFVKWAIVDGHFRGTERCPDTAGACWVFIKMRLFTFMFGFYEPKYAWRPVLVLLMWAAGIVGLFRLNYSRGIKIMPFLILVCPVMSWLLLDGRALGLPHVESARWGGLLLSLLIALTGLSFAFPLGLLLALGRRSDLPLIKAFSIAWIELWRGVPLIAVLFMSSVMIPLLLPPGTEIDKLIRVFIGVICFCSAYMAEVIRAGLRGVPRGQSEAAAALGLNKMQSLLLVVLPQALQAVIPSLVNQFISTFKDTSLVVVVGMFDLLGTVQAANTDPYWLGYATEGYIFAGLIYWCISFSLSRFSSRLEGKT